MELTPKAAACAAAVTALVLTAHAFAQNPRRSVTINGRDAAAREVLVRFVRQPADAEQLAIERDADADESEPVGPVLRRLRSRSLDVETESIQLAADDVPTGKPQPLRHPLNGLLGVGGCPADRSISRTVRCP